LKYQVGKTTFSLSLVLFFFSGVFTTLHLTLALMTIDEFISLHDCDK